MSDYVCPSCGSDEGFEVSAEISDTVRIDGHGEVQEEEDGGSLVVIDNSAWQWDNTAPMTCENCGHEGMAEDFDTEA